MWICHWKIVINVINPGFVKISLGSCLRAQLFIQMNSLFPKMLTPLLLTEVGDGPSSLQIPLRPLWDLMEVLSQDLECKEMTNYRFVKRAAEKHQAQKLVLIKVKMFVAWPNFWGVIYLSLNEGAAENVFLAPERERPREMEPKTPMWCYQDAMLQWKWDRKSVWKILSNWNTMLRANCTNSVQILWLAVIKVGIVHV